MCSPDFADFSVFFAGLATTCHHNCCVKSCHSRPGRDVISFKTANLSILAGTLKRMLDFLSFMSRSRSVHASLGKVMSVRQFGSVHGGVLQREAPPVYKQEKRDPS